MSVSTKSTRTTKSARSTRRGNTHARTRSHANEPAGGLERALDHLPLVDPACDAVLAATVEGVIASWSDAAELLFGYPRAEVVGQPLSVLWPSDRETQVAGEVIEAALARALAGEGGAPIDAQAVAKDGRTLAVRVTVAPVRGSDGEALGSALLFREGGFETTVEAKLESSEETQLAVLAALHDAVVVQDHSGHVIATNERARHMLGLADDAALESADRALASFIYEDGSPVPTDELPTMVSLRTGEPQQELVMGLRDPDGHVGWFAVNSVPVRRQGEDEPYAAAGAFTDVTESRQTSQELSAARLEDLKRLALVSEYRNDETHRHTERVARSTALLAMELGLERELAWTIARAAPLHDVGKVGIPDSVLLKPGKLTADEFEVMKTHTSIGGRILGESDFGVLQMGREIALTHHERWDGHGYPTGLSAEDIPISGRIVAVTDAFDAMTHPRPYKDAISIDEALAELKRCRGTQFDPDVVDAFMALDHETLVDRL